MSEQTYLVKRADSTLQEVLLSLLVEWHRLSPAVQSEVDAARMVLAARLPGLQTWARASAVIDFLLTVEALPGVMAIAGEAIRAGKGRATSRSTGFIGDEQSAELVALLQRRPQSLAPQQPAFYPISLYADVIYPTTMTVGTLDPLVVRLQPEPPEPDAAPAAVVYFADLETPMPVEILVTAPGFQEGTGSWARTVQAYSDRPSQPAVFMLQPESPTDSRRTLSIVQRWMQQERLEPTLLDSSRRILIRYYTPAGGGIYATHVTLSAAHAAAVTRSAERPSAAALATAPPIDLHTRVDFPSQVRPGDEQPLVVQLTTDGRGQGRVAGTVQVGFADPGRPERVEAVVTAPGFQERTGDWSRTLTVYSALDSQPAVFLLRAGTELGTQSITVDFYHRGRSIGSAAFATEITHAAAVAATPQGTVGLELQLGPLSANPPLPADVELRIVKMAHGNELSFMLHSHLAQVGYHYTPMGSVTLNAANPQEFLVNRFQALSRWAAQGAAAQDAAEASRILTDIETLGESLFTDLFPAELQRAYWRLKALREQGVIRSLLITSDEPWIPWELVKPFDWESGAQDDFLAGSFQLSRWLAGPGLADGVDLRAARVVVPELDLAFVEQEGAYFELLRQRGVDVGSRLRTRDEVLELVERGGVQLLHVAAHAAFNPADADESPVVLQDRVELYPRDLRGRRARPLSLTRPIVFLNTCHSAQLGFTLTGLGGWADALVNHVRVSAFVGGMWEVNDELAADFAHQFYEGLWQQMTLGEAFQAARHFIRQKQPSNSTWLAYTLYGDPNIRVRWPQATLADSLHRAAAP